MRSMQRTSGSTSVSAAVGMQGPPRRDARGKQGFPVRPGRAVPILVPAAFVLKQDGAALLDGQGGPICEVGKVPQVVSGRCWVRAQERLPVHAQSAFDGIEQVEQYGANRSHADGMWSVCV